MSTYSTLVLY
ncbi:hypothetical protein LSH36_307g02033 [Paralvinella palmiformis]|uniref:Uncharacterized protein n=1 Tax=Paralvinella palmiformis TaxID=53620 RepID=A0AAD9N1B5_9ANNE|nr:hypothetical protein LSH36_307g02033 [Paralvinella palmiformis]